MASNSEIEDRWIDAWNDLADIVNSGSETWCQLPDSSVISAEECQGWLQDSAYAGYHVRVERGWVKFPREGGWFEPRRGAVVSRWRDLDSPAFLRTALGRGLPLDAALAALRRYGSSPIESIKAVREVQGVSLGVAKRRVAVSSAWEDLGDEHKRLVEEIVAVFESSV